MARRRFQRGMLQLREGREKVWYGRWHEDIVAPDGTLKRIYKNQVLGTLKDFPTKRLAARELEKRLTTINSQTYTPTRLMTFGNLAERWKETVLPTHKPSSQNSEKTHLKHLVAYFGTTMVPSITTEAIQRWVTTTQMHPKTLRNHYKTLQLVLKSARVWGYMERNVCDDVQLPHNVPVNRRVFTLEDMQRIIEAAKEPWKIFYSLAAETGMRIGELLGLRVSDVDPAGTRVQVRQNLSRGQVCTPKTAAGTRTFGISQDLAEALAKLCEQRDPLAFLFASRNGNPWDHRFVVRELQGLLGRLGIERAGMHAFRHGNATLLVANNVDIKTTQKRLGHADPSITLGVYAHQVAERDHEAAEQMRELLIPAPAPKGSKNWEDLLRFAPKADPNAVQSTTYN